jgi:hypothetical protein
VLLTPSKGSPVCMHELRPGTTVCVHCRHAARAVARERRQRFLLRAGAVATIAITLGAVGVLSAAALRARGSLHKSERPVVNAPLSTPDRAVVSTPTPVVQNPPALVQTAAAAPVTPRGETVAHSKAPFAPVVPQGQSSLPDGPTAVRADSLVTVSFDMPMIRTRIAAKFEHLVRSTLPAVYGRSIDSVLSRIPEGGIARQGDLVSELPTRGVRIPVNNEWSIALYPETRPGQDGPLVIRYRVSVVGKTD